MREKRKPNAHISCEQAGLVEWGVLVTREKKMQFLPFGPAGTRMHRGRAVRPDILGGKACWAYTSTVPVERSGIWDAHRGLDALVRRHPFSSIKFGLVNELNLILSYHRVLPMAAALQSFHYGVFLIKFNSTYG